MFILNCNLPLADQPPPHPRRGRPLDGHWWWLIVVWCFPPQRRRPWVQPSSPRSTPLLASLGYLHRGFWNSEFMQAKQANGLPLHIDIEVPNQINHHTANESSVRSDVRGHFWLLTLLLTLMRQFRNFFSFSYASPYATWQFSSFSPLR